MAEPKWAFTCSMAHSGIWKWALQCPRTWVTYRTCNPLCVIHVIGMWLIGNHPRNPHSAFIISNICYFSMFTVEVSYEKVGKYATTSAVRSRESFWSVVGKMWLEFWVTTATACVPHQALLWKLHWGQAEEETVRSPPSHLLFISLFWENPGLVPTLGSALSLSDSASTQCWDFENNYYGALLHFFSQK